MSYIGNNFPTTDDDENVDGKINDSSYIHFCSFNLYSTFIYSI